MPQLAMDAGSLAVSSLNTLVNDDQNPELGGTEYADAAAEDDGTSSVMPSSSSIPYSSAHAPISSLMDAGGGRYTDCAARFQGTAMASLSLRSISRPVKTSAKISARMPHRWNNSITSEMSYFPTYLYPGSGHLLHPDDTVRDISQIRASSSPSSSLLHVYSDTSNPMSLSTSKETISSNNSWPMIATVTGSVDRVCANAERPISTRCSPSWENFLM